MHECVHIQVYTWTHIVLHLQATNETAVNKNYVCMSYVCLLQETRSLTNKWVPFMTSVMRNIRSGDELESQHFGVLQLQLLSRWVNCTTGQEVYNNYIVCCAVLQGLYEKKLNVGGANTGWIWCMLFMYSWSASHSAAVLGRAVSHIMHVAVPILYISGP